MWSANLLRRHLFFNHFGHHRIFHLQSQSQSQSQWLFTRTAVRCFSLKSSKLPVRYVAKRRRQQLVDNQQSHISLHDENMLKTQGGPILNHWHGHQKRFTDEQHIKLHSQVVDSAQQIAHIEGIKLNQEFSSDGLVHEECMQPTDQVFHVDKKQSTSSLTHISLLDAVPSTSDSTLFRPNSFQGLPVHPTAGKMPMPNTEGPILNHSDGHGNDFTDKEKIKIRKQAIDCMRTGQEIAHSPLTYKSGGLPTVPSASDSTVFRPNSFQGLPVNRTEGKMPNTEGTILNHSDRHGKDFTDKEQIKIRKQVIDCMRTGQEIAHIEGIKLNQEFSSDGLVHEECMQATDEVFDVDKKQSTSSLTHISLLDAVPSTSDSTVFRPNSFQGLPVDRTEGKMPNTVGPILNHSNGHGKDFTDKEQIKIRKQVIDCMRTGQEIAHIEGIKLNQEFSRDGLVHEECMQATEEVFDVDKKKSTSSLRHISLLDAVPFTSDSTVFRPNSFQGLPVDRTEGKMPNTEGPILNHSDGHGKDFTDKEQIKIRKQVIDCMRTGQEIAHIEGIKLNQEFSSDGLVHEECMQATEEVFNVDKKQSTSSLTHISLLDAVPSTSDSTVFRSNSFQGLPVDHTEGKLPNTEGPILNHSDGHGKDFSDKEQIKIRKQVIDCMRTGQEIAHSPLTYKSGGLPEGIKLNEEWSCDGFVAEEFVEEFVEATDEVFEDVQSNDTYIKAKPDKTRKGAVKLAAHLIAKRAVTAVELRKKLVAKLFPLNIVEAVVRDFQGRGLINDGLYAESFSHSKWKSSSWGPGRIKQALSQKGVSKHTMEKAVKVVFEDSDEEVEQGSSVRVSSSSLDKLYIQASKQWQRGHDEHPEKRKGRVIRWLQYRGFDWGVIGTIIKKLESKHPRATLP